jgi:predicted nucleic acid-binding protein
MGGTSAASDAMIDRVFVDTSVLVAAHDLDGGERRAIAEHVLRALWQDETGVISAQVLQEFYTALTIGHASPVPRRAARDLMQAYSVWPVVTLDAGDLLGASDTEERYRLPFRDAMIVTAARKSGASLLVADGIEPFRPITGLDVKNPFA